MTSHPLGLSSVEGSDVIPDLWLSKPTARDNSDQNAPALKGDSEMQRKLNRDLFLVSRRVRKICGKRRFSFVMSGCLSVRPHGTIRLPLDAFQ